MDKEWAVPKPRMLHTPLCLIVDSGTRTKEDLLSVEFTMHPGDIENLCQPPVRLVQQKNRRRGVIDFKTDTSREAEAPAEGSVIPFTRRETS